MSCGPLCGCPAGRHPVLIGDVLPDVIAALLEREGKGGESPLSVADSGSPRGTIRGQIKTAPAVRQHCDSGASPTGLESTDG